MSRLLIVANRLPVTIERRKGRRHFGASVGGLSTGLGSFAAREDALWVGWAEVPNRLGHEERDELRASLRESCSCEPVFLTQEDVSDFYLGFSNRTIWPLFHYFTRYAEYEKDFWSAYERVNRKYRDAVLDVFQPGDRIWVQDYQLMLLPAMLREKLPDASIGFFLHIPFPSFELFRLLPWRREVLEGLLGAGLIGFHTHDYVRHFLASVRALLGHDDRNGRLQIGDRLVLVDAFPMGIDFDRFSRGASPARVARERSALAADAPDAKLVLSVDRMDYTKGIPERLLAFDRFLEKHREWHGRVTLLCVAVPSRSRLETYALLKREVDRLVGQINGRWGTTGWVPIRYLYRSLQQPQLLALYAAADVALVTPLRDGMNLIAKEYVAAHADTGGVLVLSELAGAAREMTDAVLVNPNDREAVADSIACALEMPSVEQVRRTEAMRQRLRRYTVDRWAKDFLGRLEEVAILQLAFEQYALTPDATERLLSAYEKAERRLLVLDYDGTLMPFSVRPEAVRPDAVTLELLRRLAADERNTVVVISGRSIDELERWLADTRTVLVGEHGVWMKEPDGERATIAPVQTDWKQRVAPLLEVWADRTPGSFVEDKGHSLAWHYRATQPELGRRRVQELTEALGGLAADLGLTLLDGAKVLEVKSASVNKGSAAYRWLGANYEFALVMGDDATDEDMFEVAPPSAWTIRIGRGASRATFAVKDVDEARSLLTRLAESDAAVLARL